MPPLLAVRGLSLHYPDGKRALSDFDLEVQPGALTVLLGGNGCGKTTLLRCINRALTPTAGEVWLDGAELTPLHGDALRRARLDIAMIWQQANLIRRRTVLANVAAGALGRHQTWWTALGGLPAEEVGAAHSYLAGVGLAHLAGQRAGTLSGGQAQRVAIARALAQRPRLLLADEPVASLDPEAAHGIMRLLQLLAHRDGLAVLCVLHQVDLAYDYADRIVGVRAGRLAFDEFPANLPREQVQDLYLAEVERATVAAAAE
jgi:phosphonate transport system ATP-binding protein